MAHYLNTVKFFAAKVFMLQKKLSFGFVPKLVLLHHEAGKVKNAQNHRYIRGRVEDEL